ncbi:MAG: potassium transporter TrkG [Saprospiraceae bacterium]
MQTFLAFGKKYFEWVTNLIFVLALTIIVFQIIQSGLYYLQLETLHQINKIINLIFSFLTFLMSLYLFMVAQGLSIKLARLVFLIVIGIYLIMSFLWIGNMLHEQFEVESYRSFLAILVGFIAISFKVAGLGNKKIHPSLLFVFSFIFLILIGAFMLLLPGATYKGITLTQAFFTSTSAVTVTGLAILDTGKDFTFFGQVIIIILIQLGGLGVLTITNIFALIFKSTSSYRNRIMLSDMIKELDRNQTYKTLFKIIFLTFLIEAIGAIFIYFSITSSPGVSDKPWFFSIFHSISAFCNGGFSTLSNSLYEESVRYNYFLQMIICWLIITGGLGYTVMINHYVQIKNIFLSQLSSINILGFKYKRELKHTSTNSRIVLTTTVILLISGTLLFFWSEYNDSLKEHDLFGKIVVSFFNSTTARTAGFNNIDMSTIGIPAIMLIMALMWVGASPGSTGGGIKTTTFAVVLLNLWNQIKGKEKLIIKLKEIPATAINQVNAVVILSIFAISFGTFLLSVFEPQILFKDILFECISAYSTVGLSVGITPKLSEAGHITLIIIMFLGRVSFLTFLIGLFSRMFNHEKGSEPYYPKESVFIN